MDYNGHKAIVFIARTGLQYYSTHSHAVVSMGFDQKIIRDMDIVDRPNFAQQLNSFIAQNKLEPAIVLFVFSEPSCFYQDIKESDLSKIEQITEEFVNTVPFETLLTRAYPMRGGSRIVSINEKLYRDIAAAFESKGFMSIGVLPSFTLGARFEKTTSLDAVSARVILADIDKYKEQSFLATSGYHDDGEPEPEQKIITKGTKITPGLIGLIAVFVVLIGVFVFLLVRQ